VARLLVDKRKDHAPRQVRCPPPQLTVYKVADPPGAQTDRHKRCHEIGHLEKRAPGLPPKQPHGDEYTQHTAME